MKRLIPVLLSSLFLFGTCSKRDDNPDPEKTSVLLTKVRTYWSGDTTKVPDNVDSILYNQNGQVEKIHSRLRDLDAIFAFTYNSNGQIIQLNGRSDVDRPYEYYFDYNTAGKITEIRQEFTTIAGFKFISKFIYTNDGKLSEIFTTQYSASNQAGFPRFHTKYFHSTRLDSIYADDVTVPARLITRFPNTTPNKAALTLNKPYIMMAAAQSSPFLNMFSAVTSNIFVHQLVNPDEILFNDYTSEYQHPDVNQQEAEFRTNVKFTLNAADVVGILDYLDAGNTLKVRYLFQYVEKRD